MHNLIMNPEEERNARLDRRLLLLLGTDLSEERERAVRAVTDDLPPGGLIGVETLKAVILGIFRIGALEAALATTRTTIQ
jgi:hypothetical protein